MRARRRATEAATPPNPAPMIATLTWDTARLLPSSQPLRFGAAARGWPRLRVEPGPVPPTRWIAVFVRDGSQTREKRTRPSLLLRHDEREYSLSPCLATGGVRVEG